MKCFLYWSGRNWIILCFDDDYSEDNSDDIDALLKISFSKLVSDDFDDVDNKADRDAKFLSGDINDDDDLEDGRKHLIISVLGHIRTRIC